MVFMDVQDVVEVEHVPKKKKKKHSEDVIES